MKGPADDDLAIGRNYDVVDGESTVDAVETTSGKAAIIAPVRIQTSNPEAVTAGAAAHDVGEGTAYDNLATWLDRNRLNVNGGMSLKHRVQSPVGIDAGEVGAELAVNAEERAAKNHAVGSVHRDGVNGS